MQTKAIIVILALFIGALVVFNAITSTQHSTKLDQLNATETAPVDTSTDTSTTVTQISDKPLDQQPKAIMDKATKQIEEANQLEANNIQQVESL